MARVGHIRGRMGPILGVALLALVYWAAATLGLSQELPGTNATAVWAPTGVSLAALFLFGLRLWPGVALGAFLANVGTDVPIASVVGITAGNTLEALAGTWMLRRAR
ncbi:MAG TPA: MASE1 domain-containing protein, partial [Gaiellales bacterium]|nr:MASE1 domain-containing protein [Gaiellales bacterium]